MSNGVHEIEDAALLFVFGYNGADSHPIVARRIVRAKQKGATIICCDPRRVETARIADMHLQLKNGSNLALVNALANVIIEENLCDENFITEHSSGFEEFRELAKKYTPEAVAATTQIEPEVIRKAARLYATSGRSMILYGMGVCQFAQAVNVVKGLANLAIMTGNFGRWGVGIGPVRGQNNVQGACDMGALPNCYPGYQNVTVPEVQAKFEKAWGIKLSNKIGIPLTQVPHYVLHETEEKKIRAYYIFGEDPAQSDPDLAEVREALEKIELVIFQDIYMNKTGQFADVVLPATGWNEHDGVYSCCDRGFQRIRKLIDPPANANVLTDWEIISRLSTAMGYPMKYNNTEEIWNEVIDLCPTFYGATYEKLEKLGNIQWPCRSRDLSDKGTSFLHKDGHFAHPDGRAKFSSIEWQAPTELENEEFPLILSTVREVGHYSVRTMTGNCRLLRNLEDEPGWIQMNPKLCRDMGLKHGELVKVLSKRGYCITRCLPTDRVKRQAVYMTYQWWVGACNELTIASLDPISNTPEYKYCACRVEKIEDQAWAELFVKEEYEKIRSNMGIILHKEAV
ncbi:MAG: formate dehydrogenase subunit alpha [Candidatus Adiutrix intracellularis]|jgi:formate dehydrogenase major subunit|nr:MAG: formate dehydrogenase subunit alpha [Candidatus Adiutrix intracellularis]